MKIHCPTCDGLHEENRECPICAAFERMRAIAKEKGMMKGRRPSKREREQSEPPKGMWWQA